MKILRAPEVTELLGVSRVTLWRWERDGIFPARMSLGPNSVGWLASDIEAWLRARRGEAVADAADAPEIEARA